MESLPNEVVRIISQLCTVPDTARLARTSRRLHAALNDAIYQRNREDEPPQESCVLWAAAFGRIDTLNKAIWNGADMNVGKSLFACRARLAYLPRGEQRGYIFPSPLHLAVIHGHRSVVETLLDNGAVLDAPFLEFAHGGPPSFMSRPGLDRLRFRGLQDGTGTIMKSWVWKTYGGLASCYRQVDMAPWESLAKWVAEINDPVTSDHVYNHNSPHEGFPHAFPLQIACCSCWTEDLALLLIQRGARRVSRDTLAINMAIVTSKMTLFEELLQQHKGELAQQDKFIVTQLRMAVQAAPLDIVRMIFPRLWKAGIANASESVGEWVGAEYFAALVSGRLKEALALLEALGDSKLDDYFRRVSLAHCWYPGLLKPQDSDTTDVEEGYFRDAAMSLYKALAGKNTSVYR